MSQKEMDTSSGKKQLKYFLFLLLPLIAFGLYQLFQSNLDKTAPNNHTEVLEKSLSEAKENSQVVVIYSTPKEGQSLNPEKEIDSNTDAGIFMDTRDGQSYPWVRLKDGKKWLAKNLNYQTENTWCYEDNQDNCKKYGRLYTWQAATNACPNGWRLPTDEEWWTMASYYGKAYNSYRGQQKMEGPDDGEIAYKALVQAGDTGFAALFGGSYATNEGFDYLGDLGCYWSRSENTNTANAFGYYFYIHSRALARDSYHKTLGFSCRCMQE